MHTHKKGNPHPAALAHHTVSIYIMYHIHHTDHIYRIYHIHHIYHIYIMHTHQEGTPATLAHHTL